MKKLIFIILLTGVIYTSCNNVAKKEENTENKAVEAKESFNKVSEEYLTEVENFKKETAAKIDANNLMIAEFKVKTIRTKNEVKDYYENQIAALQQKNMTMKTKLDAYEETGKENWETFKTDFNSDMKDLGEAFKNFTIKNE